MGHVEPRSVADLTTSGRRTGLRCSGIGKLTHHPLSTEAQRYKKNAYVNDLPSAEHTLQGIYGSSSESDAAAIRSFGDQAFEVIRFQFSRDPRPRARSTLSHFSSLGGRHVAPS
jgi:hypothetical protein